MLNIMAKDILTRTLAGWEQLIRRRDGSLCLDQKL